MKTHRHNLIGAGALLLVTAVAGAAVHGVGRGNPPAGTGATPTFAAASGGPVSFTGQLDRTAVRRGQDNLVRMELVMAAKSGPDLPSVRHPTDLVVILDRSGSMAGDKITHARAAVRELLSQLGADDRYALVTYADEASVAIPLSPALAPARAAWIGAVAEIQPGGSTNMSSGLDLGIDLVEQSRAEGRVPHVILISDGLANQGDPTPQGLRRRAQRTAQSGYMLTTVGVGTDFDENLMTALADAGTGNYYYLRNAADLGNVFAREFGAARSTVAAALSVRIEPGRGVRVVDAAGYPLEAAGDAVIFRPGSLFAGQERRVWVTLAVPNQVAGDYDLGRFSLAYGNGGERATLAFSDTPRVACVDNEEEFYSKLDVGAWSRAVVVDAYNEMQQGVAQAVQEGRRDEALQKVREFKDKTAAINAHVQSAPVAAQLESAERLESKVEDAFKGGNEPAKQNELSKAVGAAAVDARRAGNKK